VDGDNYQVGAAVAEFLEIPQISIVVKEEISDGKITCHQITEGGTVIVETPLPALLTTQKGLNEPRYASLPGIMKAKKKPLEQKTLADLGIDAGTVGKANAKAKVIALNTPSEREAVRIIEGETAQEQVAALFEILHGEAKVI